MDWTLIAGVWGCEDLPNKKPDPSALTPVLSKWNRGEIIYFGDAYTDYQMCIAAQIPFVQVLSGKDAMIEGCQTLRNLGELIELLKRTDDCA